jgi:decaprenyl-phosphate phosphoribosyltransferase
MLTEYIKLIRVSHWIKNIFVFFPLFFHGTVASISNLNNCIAVFIAFCCISSCIYIINDYMDIKLDRLHSEKRNRPLAKGTINKANALTLLLVLLAAVILICIFWIKNHSVSLVIAIYAINNVIYSFYIKKIAVADIASIATGFVLRVIGGGVATNIPVSNWLILMTFLLALFIGLAKRRDDVLLMNDNGVILRHSLTGYNKTFIDNAMTMMCSVLITCYLLYLSSGELKKVQTPYIFLTAIPVVLGILRYMQITFVKERSGSPVSILYKDIFLQVCIAVWLLTFSYFIYFFKLN